MTRARPDGPRTWWGEHAFAAGWTGSWQVGPTRFWIRRTEKEWRCRRLTGDDPDAADLRWSVTADEQEPEDDGGEIDRLALRRTGDRLRVTPVPADRAIVAHPEHRLHIPPDEEVVLYVSTPLWVRLETVDPVRTFVEFPLLRPSDTWFGPSPLEGELCYATRTAARLDPGNVRHRPHRVVTALRLVNHADETMVIDKLKLPLVNMAVYAGADGRLWTEKVTLEQTEAGGHAGMTVGRKPPSIAGETRPAGPARSRPGRNLLVWAFGARGAGGEDA